MLIAIHPKRYDHGIEMNPQCHTNPIGISDATRTPMLIRLEYNVTFKSPVPRKYP